MMKKTQIILELAQAIAKERPAFFRKKGPGLGDHDTGQFMSELRKRATAALGNDYSERHICGDDTKLAVDFYIPSEGVIIEIALGLRNPTSEFERDILKAIMAKRLDHKVRRLVFLSKPGAAKRHQQPSSKAFVAWVKHNYNIAVEFHELVE